MKADRILNPELIRQIARLGHTQSMVICDAGLPIPEGIPVVDISLVRGAPSLRQAMEAVAAELVAEACVYAAEAEEQNPGFMDDLRAIFPGLPSRAVAHEEFKRLCAGASFFLRTGEASSYANVILIGGVNF